MEKDNCIVVPHTYLGFVSSEKSFYRMAPTWPFKLRLEKNGKLTQGIQKTLLVLYCGNAVIQFYYLCKVD